MIHWKTTAANLAVAGIVGAVVAAFSSPANAGPPRAGDQYDLEASGFVLPPTGPVPEGAYMPGPGFGGQVNVGQMGVPHAAMQQMSMPPGMIQPKGVPAGGVAPAGFASGPVSMTQYPAAQNTVIQAGGSPSHGFPNGGVMPTGFFGNAHQGQCDSIGCQSCGSEIGCGCGVMESCGGGCGDGSCGGGSCGGGRCPLRAFGNGGLLGRLSQHSACEGCSGYGCGSCGGSGASQLSNLRHVCLFCRGDGCEACQSFRPIGLSGALERLRPYSEAGRSAPRYYDISVAASFLGLNDNGGTGPLTSRGIGGPIVLDTGNLIDGLEAGVKISAAFIFGVGGTLEFTYHGGHEWDGQSSVTGNNDLFSFVSDFGTVPLNGFDDSDRSVEQNASLSSRFHSGEFNYRRRTAGAYGRFQGSYLFGLRYVRYDQSLRYNALAGADNDSDGVNDFLTIDTGSKNDLFGGQVGFDLWYSAMAGLNFGVGLKGAWLKNELRSDGFVSANSLDPTGSPATIFLDNGRRDDGTVLLDFEFAMLYRLSHSWTFRGGYQVIAIDDIGSAGANAADIAAVRGLADGSTAGFDVSTNSLVLQGFTVGAEYTW